VINHIVVHLPDRSLVDRQTLAMLIGRSEETIRRRVPVVEYRQGKALYDMDAATEALSRIRRRRTNAA
jgi:hypothetical protein